MVLTDKYTNQQVLGCLMKNPLLLVNHEVKVEDFGTNKVAKIIFISIRNLFESGAKTLTPIEIDQDIERYEASATIYKQEKGLEVLKECYEISQEANFVYYYERLKKLTLLRVLGKKGYDISPYYKKEFDTLKEENETITRFDEATIDDILNYVEGNYNRIKQDFLNGRKEDEQAAKGIDELIDSLLAQPEIGVPICGNMYNTAMMGGRLGKFYVRSAASGTGKSRLAVFDACKICFPSYWSFETHCFVKEVQEDGHIRKPRKTLLITTELAKDEIQTMILAYLSGVNEAHILMGNYIEGELERVRFAARIMKKYQDYLYVDEISDPNLTNIQASIRKFATIEKVKYVFC